MHIHITKHETIWIIGIIWIALGLVVCWFFSKVFGIQEEAAQDLEAILEERKRKREINQPHSDDRTSGPN